MQTVMEHTPRLDTTRVLGELASVILRSAALEDTAAARGVAPSPELDGLADRQHALETLLATMPPASSRDALSLVALAAGQIGAAIDSEGEPARLERAHAMLVSGLRFLVADAVGAKGAALDTIAGHYLPAH